MFGLDGQIYTPATADFHVAMAEMLLRGFPVAGNPNAHFPAFKPEQVAIGLPMSSQAAGSGFTAENEVKKTLDYLVTGKSFGGNYQLINPTGYCAMKGVMGWSINWDATRNYAFGNFYSGLLQSYPDCNGNNASARAQLKCTFTITEEEEDEFTGILVVENPNTSYAWNGNYFDIRSIGFNTTSEIVSATSPDGVITITPDNESFSMTLGWQSLFPLGKKVEITIKGVKKGNNPSLTHFKPVYVRGNNIDYPVYADLPQQWKKGKETPELSDLIADTDNYYKSEAEQVEDHFIVYNPAHATQVNIGQVMSVDYPVNTAENVRIWIPSRYMAMGIAFNYEMFKINPHYMCALGTKENFSAGVVPPEAGNTNNPVIIDGKTWYWPIVDHPDGPFQQETGNFIDCKSLSTVSLFFPTFY